MKRLIRLICLLVVVGILFISQKSTAYAQNLESHIDSHLAGETETRTNINDAGTAQTPDELKELNISNDLTITYNNGNGELAGSLRILLTLTLIALAPLLLVMLTSFTRIIIVLHFTRSALNTSTAPPNNVLIGLALILTFFIMQGTLTKAYNEAVLPFDRGEITQAEAIEKVMNPFRDFMYGQTQTKDVRLFMEIADVEWDGALSSIPNYILVPSFVVSELRTAFIIGFIIYIPFVVIDMIVASVLMSMGMMMLPPTTISMPFKVLLFVLADGWNLIIGSLVKSFY
ncbi:MAG: flagellar type III secretion system pore protein FliP [Lachnospiraceae bacterium]|nr:flagellar type III secretion system pore protein FliP [Lachnospiraceae bacterium]MBR5993967.1 flagellar type III secretion system pore protein FliP [Lachnospiraceae bacterium]